jgi:hypothetical protein
MTMASHLLGRAVATFRVVPPEERAPAITALDAFLADPSPAQLVASCAVLGRLRRAAEQRGPRATIARHRFEHGLAALAAVPGIDPAIVETLRSIDVDARTGARLEAIAALLVAHRELAGRAAAETLALRRRLGYDESAPLPSPTSPARSSRRR